MNTKKTAFAIMKVSLRIIIIALLILLFTYLGKTAFVFGQSIFSNEAMDPKPGRQVTVVLSDQDSTMDIGKKLEEKGLVNDSLAFFVREKLSKYSGKLKPGTYTLNTSMNSEELITVLAGDAEKSDEEAEAETQ